MIISLTAAGNILKSLGPNDKLVKAVAEMNVLLSAETSIVLAQVNKRTSEIHDVLKDNSFVGAEVCKRTIGIQESVHETSIIGARIDERTSGMQEDLSRVDTGVEQLIQKVDSVQLQLNTKGSSPYS